MLTFADCILQTIVLFPSDFSFERFPTKALYIFVWKKEWEVRRGENRKWWWIFTFDCCETLTDCGPLTLTLCLPGGKSLLRLCPRCIVHSSPVPGLPPTPPWKWAWSGNVYSGKDIWSGLGIYWSATCQNSTTIIFKKVKELIRNRSKPQFSTKLKAMSAEGGRNSRWRQSQWPVVGWKSFPAVKRKKYTPTSGFRRLKHPFFFFFTRKCTRLS